MFSIVTDVNNALGECPLWCEKTRRVFWTDIEGSELLAFEKESGIVKRWSLPERAGSFALTGKADVLLIGLASQLAFYDLNTEVLTPVASSPGMTGTRIGDGRCDRSGNFVFSSMLDGDYVQKCGQFHRLNAATLETETLALPAVVIPNSICFSPDGGTMYYSDSMQGQIFCCDYPSLDNQRIFVKVEDGGAPDGSCIDAQGYLWNAEWGGSRVVRYTDTGNVDRVIQSPSVQTTCPVLAGPSYETLYCTSAKVGLDKPTDSDGMLIKAEEMFSAGLPEVRFAGPLNN
ncbi:SMP-30/gluconolactonase/LRE family protein [Marinomonas rhizomae]|uniref:SMP-30/gluconolactonase/LRE family protein n=1 Tax=Marinomonas rhizomae TaxID=491948 RepID=UPI0021085CB8|nr:SMP-30/gluconolactonase/LRE family protein [Marinomonas rhizomae]UTV98207.1 SMP-30/gluconolactonase/LRE family protein [Marinomonas rhizomae]